MRSPHSPATLAATVATALLLVSCGAVEADGHGDAHGDDTAPVDGATEVAVTAESLAFTPDQLEIDAGEPVNLALTATDVLHDLTIDEPDFHIAADVNETVVGGVSFEQPGTYTAYCSVPGHRDAGMELDIIVR